MDKSLKKVLLESLTDANGEGSNKRVLVYSMIILIYICTILWFITGKQLPGELWFAIIGLAGGGTVAAITEKKKDQNEQA